MTMMSYIADEVKEQNVAVNVLVPGHTRTTGYIQQNQARAAAGSSTGPVPMRPEHMVPLALFLADRDAASGVTGKTFDVMTWNIEHGLGGAEAWAFKE
jgi:NAD(P)-dependent dehydrogenase (short-subunit alcohol dehydrogenase family)